VSRICAAFDSLHLRSTTILFCYEALSRLLVVAMQKYTPDNRRGLYGVKYHETWLLNVTASDQSFLIGVSELRFLRKSTATMWTTACGGVEGRASISPSTKASMWIDQFSRKRSLPTQTKRTPRHQPLLAALHDGIAQSRFWSLSMRFWFTEPQQRFGSQKIHADTVGLYLLFDLENRRAKTMIMRTGFSGP